MRRPLRTARSRDTIQRETLDKQKRRARIRGKMQRTSRKRNRRP